MITRIKKLRSAQTLDAAHGRIEERKIVVISAGECGIHWPGLMQIGRITRTRTLKKTGKTTTESICFITSLPQSQTTPEQLLALNRHHWAVENSLHWVKDTVFREDASTLRTKNAPNNAAILRNMTLNLIKNNNMTPTIAREKCAAKIKNAIKMIQAKK